MVLSSGCVSCIPCTAGEYIDEDPPEDWVSSDTEDERDSDLEVIDEVQPEPEPEPDPQPKRRRTA